MAKTERMIQAMTGRQGAYNFLASIAAQIDTEFEKDINTMRDGAYKVGSEGIVFIGFECKGMPDGYRAVEVTTEEKAKYYFVDMIRDEWCINSKNINEETFNEFKKHRIHE